MKSTCMALVCCFCIIIAAIGTYNFGSASGFKDGHRIGFIEGYKKAGKDAIEIIREFKAEQLETR